MALSDGLPHELGDSTAFPDLMNDPAFATNYEGKERNFEDPDTCRICRGEGSEEEQLFYPCKCSGSIKFVHQACLVEWLSHSQKKHCELCKTPFRFTKLYDPNMPRELPAPLFVKQVLVHSFRSVVTWLRFGLVAFVWLVWLPWSMRAMWRGLFWLADGRWPSSNSQRSSAQGLSQIMPNGSAIDAAMTLTSLASSSTTAGSAATDLPSLQTPAPSMFSFPTGDPVMLSLFKKVLSVLFFPGLSSSASPSDSNLVNSTTRSGRQRHPSWLSDVKFLNSLTPSPTFNNILIDTLEGQLITLLVVISFILVFLIREWVVQQQPMANIADGEREAAVQLIANDRQDQPAEAPRPEHQPRFQADLHNEAADEHVGNISDDGDGGNSEAHSATSEGSTDIEDFRIEDSNTSPVSRRGDENDEGTHDHVRYQPYAPHDHTWPGVETFRDLWTRANGDPEEVLRIVREEGRQEDLGWVVLAMTRLQQHGWSPPSVSGAQPAPADTDSTSQVNADDIADDTEDDLNEGTGEMSEEFPSFTPRDHFGSSSPTTGGQSWNSPIAAGASSAGNVRPGTPQPEFMFDLPDLTYNTNPFQTQPVREGDRASSTNMVPANSALGDNANSPGNTGELLQSDNATAQPPKNLTGRVLDWFWGDITPAGLPQERLQHDEEHVVEDPALEAPFVPVQNNRRPGDDEVQDGQWMNPVAVDAGLDPNDADAIEDGDDLEGILELIGMQGPIFGLLQNGVFSALLISFTVAIGIWLPYLWGKIALVLLANPIQLMLGVPVAAVSIVADVTLDTLIGSLGYVMYWASLICKAFLSPFGDFIPLGTWIPQTKSVTSASLSLIDASSHRLKLMANAFFTSHQSDLPVFSVLSHQALKMHEARISGFFRSIFAAGKFILHDLPLHVISSGLRGAVAFDYKAVGLGNVLIQAREQVHNFVHTMFSLMTSAKWINSGAVDATPVNIPADADLAVWNTKDRVIAIIMGYLLVSFIGLLYLRITGLLSGVNRGQRIEGIIAEVLQQAGGVMKVILIIGIEMIVFPLYCGSLLDVALLPLFDNATIASRIDFTSSSPLTSLFVHWFIGTCYMFHFALFVSMCRKVMRSGVLYFIRDPDDPTFHPVRDVLERNITTQLRKIAFSALVYGALVIVCLGGVVWGLHYAFDGVLPIHWSATIPVLEFPVDLLFYNFVMPLALRSIKPSDGLHSLYNWWFHRCARFLRLSNFFFGETERHRDEEGYHARRTWWDVLLMKRGDAKHPITSAEQLSDKKDGVYFVRDGKYVRAPASDQVRIPKGSRVFLEVTEDNKRVDGALDWDNGLHGRNSDMFAKVYVPPHFRARIAFFIFLIWVFAATSGVGITIIPLVIGRKLISSFFPESVPLNDIYAFSLGLCIFGAGVYALLYGRTALRMAKDYLHRYMQSPREACVGLATVALNGCRLTYIAAAFGVLLPSLLALIMEFYVLVPLHTYFGGTQSHVIHFVQDWTLGVLYVQMAAKFVLWYSTSRPAAALNSIFRDGWLRPNASLATRALVLPVSLLAGIAVALPLFFGFVLNSTMYSSNPDVQFKVYRYAYPVTLLIGLAVWAAYMVRRRVEIWRVNIRDDVYLIGERLHNFSEKRAKDVGAARRVITG